MSDDADAVTLAAPRVVPVPRTAVIVVAAGSGTRLGAGAPKAFVGIDEHPVLRHALRGVLAAPFAQVVVVAPAGMEGDALTEALAAADAADAAATAAAGTRRDLISVVTGAASRQGSVAAGLTALWADVQTVLVHDAARALTPADVFVRVADAVARTGSGVIPVLPVVDTIKRLDGATVVEGVDRATLGAAQTPQGFPRALLETAYAEADAEYTDDAALVAAAGDPVTTVAGDPLAFKITTAADLARARALVAERTAAAPTAATPTAAAPTPAASTTAQPRHPQTGLDVPARAPRVGVGTDVHAFGGEGDLRLAGLVWPGEPALSGHSDGDAVAHAIVDALLSAAGLGDIGTHFGTDRPEFAGAHADVFLTRTRQLLSAAGWRVGNVSVQLQANRPRFATRRAEAERVLSDLLGAPVSVSATTTDGLGFTGRGEGVAVFAVAQIVPV